MNGQVVGDTKDLRRAVTEAMRRTMDDMDIAATIVIPRISISLSVDG